MGIPLDDDLSKNSQGKRIETCFSLTIYFATFTLEDGFTTFFQALSE